MKRRAFAILYAIAAMALLGGLIAIVGVGVRGRVHELTEAANDAQLRQLIVAGAQLAKAGVAGEVNLPGELSETASLQISDTPQPRISASLRGREIDCPIPR